VPAQRLHRAMKGDPAVRLLQTRPGIGTLGAGLCGISTRHEKECQACAVRSDDRRLHSLFRRNAVHASKRRVPVTRW